MDQEENTIENETISEIIMLKLYNGDYIIGEHKTYRTVSEDYEKDYITLENPRAFVFMPTMGGTMKAGFQPVCFFNKESKKSLAFRREQVMLVVESIDIPKEVESGYKSEISGISIASASDIAAVNNSKDSAASDLIIG